jgi:hypothetical protein
MLKPIGKNTGKVCFGYKRLRFARFVIALYPALFGFFTAKHINIDVAVRAGFNVFK